MTNKKIFIYKRVRFLKVIQIKFATEFQIWLWTLFIKRSSFKSKTCETLTTTNKVVLAGETRGPKIDKDELISKVRDCIKDIGMIKKVLVGKQQILKHFSRTIFRYCDGS